MSGSGFAAVAGGVAKGGQAGGLIGGTIRAGVSAKRDREENARQFDKQYALNLDQWKKEWALTLRQMREQDAELKDKRIFRNLMIGAGRGVY